MEKQSRIERKKKEREEKKQLKHTNKGVATLRALADFSRVVEFGEKVWGYISDHISN